MLRCLFTLNYRQFPQVLLAFRINRLKMKSSYEIAVRFVFHFLFRLSTLAYIGGPNEALLVQFC